MKLTLSVPLVVLERYKVGDYLVLQHDFVSIHDWILTRFVIVEIDLVGETLTIEWVGA